MTKQNTDYTDYTENKKPWNYEEIIRYKGESLLGKFKQLENARKITSKFLEKIVLNNSWKR